MATLTICDASRQPLLPSQGRSTKWGWPRVYSDEAYNAVEEYLKALRAAALEAQELFADRRDAARALFHAQYPEGLLPDEESEGDGLA